jgi:hypothetical protein
MVRQRKKPAFRWQTIHPQELERKEKRRSIIPALLAQFAK